MYISLSLSLSLSLSPSDDHNKGDQSDKPIEKDSEEPSGGASNEPPKLEKQRLRLAGLTLVSPLLAVLVLEQYSYYHNNDAAYFAPSVLHYILSLAIIVL